MSKKKIFILAFSLLVAIFLFTIIYQYIVFKNSARFARYKLSVAAREHDSSLCDKYFNYEQIVDTQIHSHLNNSRQELEGNPFADLAYAMVGNIRPVLITQLKNDIKQNYETNTLPKENKLKVLWKAYHNTSNKALIKVEKINKYKEIYTDCPFEGAGCMQFTWEKVNDAWQIVNVNQISIEEATK